MESCSQREEESREVSMLAILTDSKPAISTVRKLDAGAAPPRSEIEARILKELCSRTRDQEDTCVAWVKGHKGIEGNGEADKLCREASILGHESGGGHTGGPQSLEQKGESRGERRKRRRYTRVAPQGYISLYLVRHRKRVTEEVASQNKKGRHARM